MIQKNIRSQKDLELFGKLKTHPLIERSLQSLEKIVDKDEEQRTKRHLLKSSIRLSQAVSPELYEICQHCTKTLGVEIPVELYVYSSSDFNAACFKPENGKLHIMFSSSLLESFDSEEVKFVLGHELGHYIYKHHDIPVNYILNGPHKPDPDLALELFEWSRFAEISADRAGAACVNTFQPVARSMFKLSSGISDSSLVSFNLEAYVKQIDELIALERKTKSSKDAQDWFSTHPFSPLRVKALDFFFKSELVGQEDLTAVQLETAVDETLHLMEPNYLIGQTPDDRSLRDLFIAQSVVMSHADGEFSKKEQELIGKLLEDTVEVTKINPERIKAVMPRRVEKVLELCGPNQKSRLVRDLVMVGSVDGKLGASERAELETLCSALQVDLALVDKFLGLGVLLD